MIAFLSDSEEEVRGSSLIINRFPLWSYLSASPGWLPSWNGGIKKFTRLTRCLAGSSGGFGISRPIQFCGCAAMFVSKV